MIDRRQVVLMADDDRDIISFVSINLQNEGFDVVTADDGEQALEVAFDLRPDLVLLDVMMPKLDGFEVCRRLRQDVRTRHLPVIMLTARTHSADKVVGLTAGADDYIIKPFDPLELMARVKSTLRRTQEMRAISPLTHLPGNVQIQEEIARRIKDEKPFGLMYIDLDDFKAFNDHYGFMRGDEAIKLLSECALTSLRRHDGTETFLGHVGGDDFLGITAPAAAELAAKDVITCWDEGIVTLCDPEDVARGYLEILDRREQVRRFPIPTVSIGIVTNTQRPISSHWEASEIAAEMKHVAKRIPGSSFAVDRRRGPGRPPPPPA